MNLLKRNWLVVSIILLVVTIVLIRAFSSNSFRYDAVRWAAPSADGSNLISAEQLAGTADHLAGAGDQVLVINLGGTTELPGPVGMTTLPGQLKVKTVMIVPGEILERENLKLIRRSKGPVILSSDDASVSARVWMVLSEMGIKGVYILRNKAGREEE